jgi:hypothetical protein
MTGEPSTPSEGVKGLGRALANVAEILLRVDADHL